MNTINQTDNAIFGKDITELSKSPYLTSPLKGGQDSLISKSWLYSVWKRDFPNLKSEGVCNGLCLDYARHVISHLNTGSEPNYIVKLQRKLTAFGKDSRNFVKRINMYQRDLQASEQDRINIPNSSAIFNNNKFIESLPADLSSSTVIGLSFKKKEGGGHIISIQAVKNEQAEIIGYKIFDPNIGEFDCSKDEKGDNIQHFNEVIKGIYETYNDSETGNCSVIDLEKKVKQYELVKLQGEAKYTSEYKYLENNPNTQTIDNKRLFDAVDKGNIEEVRAFLADIRAEVNKPNQNGATALYIAAQNGHTEIVKLLLADKRVDINQSKYNDTNPLFIATQNGHTEIVKLFLTDKRTEVNKRRNDSYTAFYIAAQTGNTEMVKLFLADKRTDVNKTCDGATALYIAAQNGHEDIVRMLATDRRVDLSKACEGNTPLDVAANNGDREIVKILKAALLKEKMFKTLQSKETINFYAEINELPPPVKIELIQQINLAIQDLAVEDKGWSIRKIISTFPEDKRMEYFFDSARKAVLECASRGEEQKTELILGAFPKQHDRDLILAGSLLTPFRPLAKLSLAKLGAQRIYQAVSNTLSHKDSKASTVSKRSR